MLAEQEESQHECTFIAAQALHTGFALAQGWHVVERIGAGWWTSGQGQIDIFFPETGKATIQAELYSIQCLNQIDVAVNGQHQLPILVDWGGFKSVILEIELQGKPRLKNSWRNFSASLPCNSDVFKWTKSSLEFI